MEEDVPHLVVARGRRLTEEGHVALVAYGLLLMSDLFLDVFPLTRRMNGVYHVNVSASIYGASDASQQSLELLSLSDREAGSFKQNTHHFRRRINGNGAKL